jgi:hypothetical protein
MVTQGVIIQFHFLGTIGIAVTSRTFNNIVVKWPRDIFTVLQQYRNPLNLKPYGEVVRDGGIREV